MIDIGRCAVAKLIIVIIKEMYFTRLAEHIFDNKHMFLHENLRLDNDYYYRKEFEIMSAIKITDR